MRGALSLPHQPRFKLNRRAPLTPVPSPTGGEGGSNGNARVSRRPRQALPCERRRRKSHRCISAEPPAKRSPSPLVGEGAPKGRMRGALSLPHQPRFEWNLSTPLIRPPLRSGHLLPQGEKGILPRAPEQATNLRVFAEQPAKCYPSPLEGEGGPAKPGRMRGALSLPRKTRLEWKRRFAVEGGAEIFHKMLANR
jgi:hypothetical protein